MTRSISFVILLDMLHVEYRRLTPHGRHRHQSLLLVIDDVRLKRNNTATLKGNASRR